MLLYCCAYKKYLCLYLKVAVTEKEGQRSSICRGICQVAATVRAKAKGLQLALPCGQRGQTLEPSPSLLPGQQLGHELALKWDAGVEGGGCTCYATMLAPWKLYFYIRILSLQ